MGKFAGAFERVCARYLHQGGEQKEEGTTIYSNKSELAYKYAPAIVSFVYLLFAFQWHEKISVGLLMAHRIENFRQVASGASISAFVIAILFIITPFFMAVIAWNYWNKQEGSLIGVLGTILTAVSSGFSTVLIAGIEARRGLFASLGAAEDFLQFPFGLDHIPASIVSSEQAVLWVIASVVWLVIMLTGYLVRRGHLSISFS